MNLTTLCSSKTRSISNQTGRKTPSSWAISKISAAIGLTLAVAQTAAAQLPEPLLAALNQADISTDDISLIVLPLNQNTSAVAEQNASGDLGSVSRLPAVVAPKSDEPKPNESSDITVDTTDALPPEEGTESALTEVRSNGESEAAQPLTLPIRHLPDIPRTPASTMKLIPTFVALDMLGPDFVWFTKAYHTGYISANTLYGDLIIQGSGDPKLTHRRLAILLDQVKQAGIRHIEGDIILDSSVFREVGKDPAAFDNDPLRPYNASPDGLLVNFNSIEMTTIPLKNSTQQGAASVFYKPRLADYDLPKSIAIGSGRCASARYSLAPTWQKDALKLGKALPDACGAHTFYIAYPDAKEFAKRVVKQKWLSLGNTMSGNIKFLGLSNTVSGDIINTEYPLKTKYGTYRDMGKTTNDSKLKSKALSILTSSPIPFVSYPSLPLSQQIHDINHYSNNVMTEQVTLSLPLFAKQEVATTADNAKTDTKMVVKPTKETYSDYDKALTVIDTWWQKNLETPPPVMTNGSGLCRTCSVTADNLAELLGAAYVHPHFDTYVNSLGVAGVSGTIAEHADRLPTSKAIGRAWIKTGTLNNVTSMAGYVHGQSGQDYVVVGIINGSGASSLNTYKARYALDTMLDWTAQH